MSTDHDHAGHHTDPTFYRTPRDAAEAAKEKLAYVATFARPADKPDGIAVVDVDPDSASYATVVGFTELTNLGDELHHFGWNACSSALCPGGGHDHGDRRYLIVPGLRSSRLYVLDTKETPEAPQIVKVLGPEELGKRANYSRPHTVHCGPGGLFVVLSRRRHRRGPGRRRAAGPQHVRGDRAVGGRPRRPVPGLRRLVAHHARRRDHVRVGHALDDRGWHRARNCCSAASTATGCTSGT